MIEVPCYGIHRDKDDVAWLVQRDGGSNAIGLNEPCPFEVRLPHGRKTEAQCNHQIDLALEPPPTGAWNRFVSFAKADELVRAMLPQEHDHQSVGVIDKTDIETAETVSMMSSPIRGVVRPAWTLRTKYALFEALAQTNIQPLVLTRVSFEDLPLIREAMKSLPMFARKLIICVDDGVPLPFPTQTRKLTRGVNLNQYPPLPWKQLGTEYIRRIMRGQAL